MIHAGYYIFPINISVIFFATIYESIPFIILRHLFADTFVMSKSEH